MSIHHCTIFITKHHYGLCWYEYPWCATKFLYVLKHYKRFNSPFSAKVPICHKHSCRKSLLSLLVCENKSNTNGKKNGNKMCEERLTLSIYTPGKIKQVSKEKKDHTQVKNDSSELFTVLIIHDSNM